MRCPDCGTFVPYDTEVDPEENDEPTVDEGTLRASYDRILNCESCGTELKRSTLEFDLALEVPTAECSDPEGHEWDASGLEASPTTGAVTVDRKGRPITNPRYMKTLYGVSLSGTITCEHCDATIEVEAEESVPASAMDESV